MIVNIHWKKNLVRERQKCSLGSVTSDLSKNSLCRVMGTEARLQGAGGWMWDEVIDIWDETNCSVMCMRGKEKIEFARRYMMKENSFSARELEKFLDLGKGTTREKRS